MSALSIPERKRLAGICGLFGSEYDGERATAAAAVDRFLRERAMTWDDVLHAQPPAPVVVRTDRSWRDTAEDCLNDHAQAISEWEEGFLQSVLLDGRRLTPKQNIVLRRIADKCGVPAWR